MFGIIKRIKEKAWADGYHRGFEEGKNSAQGDLDEYTRVLQNMYLGTLDLVSRSAPPKLKDTKYPHLKIVQ